MKSPGQILLYAAALLAIAVHAEDPAEYPAGDKTNNGIFAPVAPGVQATAELKSAETLETPAVFEICPEITNEITKNFLTTFAAAHENFTNELQTTFRQTILANSATTSADFEYFVTAFDVKYKKFPVSATLAEIWARGGDGADERNRLLGLIQQAFQHPLRPDETPFALGDTLRLVPVKNWGEKPALDKAADADVVAVSNTGTISQERLRLRRQFSAADQLLGGALAEFLKPDCVPDENLTRLARARAVAGLLADKRLDAGQIIVQRSETIDTKTKAAPVAPNEKLMPGILAKQIAAVPGQTPQAQEAQQGRQQAQLEHQRAETEARRNREAANAMRQQALLSEALMQEIHVRNEWLVAACMVISAATLLIFWLLLRRRNSIPIPATQSLSATKNSAAIPVDLVPHLTQAVKDALVQELAAQRREMLSAQQIATAEIAQIVHRLDELQVPLHERLRAYESQIQQLEKELAARTEENRELLKVKIEMMRRQLQAERQRVDFN